MEKKSIVVTCASFYSLSTTLFQISSYIHLRLDVVKVFVGCLLKSMIEYIVWICRLFCHRHLNIKLYHSSSTINERARHLDWFPYGCNEGLATNTNNLFTFHMVQTTVSWRVPSHFNTSTGEEYGFLKASSRIYTWRNEHGILLCYLSQSTTYRYIYSPVSFATRTQSSLGTRHHKHDVRRRTSTNRHRGLCEPLAVLHDGQKSHLRPVHMIVHDKELRSTSVACGRFHGTRWLPSGRSPVSRLPVMGKTFASQDVCPSKSEQN